MFIELDRSVLRPLFPGIGLTGLTPERETIRWAIIKGIPLDHAITVEPILLEPNNQNHGLVVAKHYNPGSKNHLPPHHNI